MVLSAIKGQDNDSCEMPQYVEGDAETDRIPQNLFLPKRATTCAFSSQFFIAAKLNIDTLTIDPKRVWASHVTPSWFHSSLFHSRKRRS